MTTDELMDYAETHGHKVVYYPLLKNKAITLDYNGSFIALSTTLYGIDEKETVAHELGHAEYGGIYNRYSPFDIKEKSENRANKWAYYKLVPPGEVRVSFKHGVLESWELAEQFNVSDDFMCEALNYYKSVGVL
jgi:hypothetical protein